MIGIGDLVRVHGISCIMQVYDVYGVIFSQYKLREVDSAVIYNVSRRHHEITPLTEDETALYYAMKVVS